MVLHALINVSKTLQLISQLKRENLGFYIKGSKAFIFIIPIKFQLNFFKKGFIASPRALSFSYLDNKIVMAILEINTQFYKDLSSRLIKSHLLFRLVLNLTFQLLNFQSSTLGKFMYPRILFSFVLFSFFCSNCA